MSSAAWPSSALRVPELLEAVLEHLAEDINDLKNACLVDQFWLYYAQPMLWRIASSDTLERLPSGSRAKIAAHIHRLTLYLECRESFIDSHEGDNIDNNNDDDDDDDDDDNGNDGDPDEFGDEGNETDYYGSLDDTGDIRDIISLAFPRLRELQVKIRRDYDAACDNELLNLLEQTFGTARLARIEILYSNNYGLRFATSVALFAHLARRPGLTFLRLDELELPPRALERAAAAAATVAAGTAAASAAEAAAAAAEIELSPFAPGEPLFAHLQCLAARVARGALVTLARLLPRSLATLQLQVVNSTRILSVVDDDDDDDDGITCGEVTDASAATPPPIIQLLGDADGNGGGRNGEVAAAAAVAAEAACARWPRLRELAVQYDEGPLTATEFDALRLLPQLQVLTVGWYEHGDNWGLRSSCNWCNDDDALYAPEITDAELERLVTSLPRLRRLSLVLRSSISDDGLRLVGRACRQLEHLELRGHYYLYDVCLAAGKEVDEYGDRGPLFPNLVFLGLTGINCKWEEYQRGGHDGRDEQHELDWLDKLEKLDDRGEINELKEPDEQDEPDHTDMHSDNDPDEAVEPDEGAHDNKTAAAKLMADEVEAENR